MPRRPKQPPLALFDEKHILKVSGLVPLPAPDLPDDLATQPLPVRIQQLIEILQKAAIKPPEDMYCFIMYDIQNNKVRTLIAKYLEKKGCLRVQKSVFFAQMHRKLYREISEVLKEIQQSYDNQDSIVMLPVGEDMLNNLLAIGQEFEFELSAVPRNTLFF